MVDKEQEARKAAASLMGKKGGPARAKALTKKQRSDIASNAAKERWKGKKKPATEPS